MITVKMEVMMMTTTAIKIEEKMETTTMMTMMNQCPQNMFDLI